MTQVTSIVDVDTGLTWFTASLDASQSSSVAFSTDKLAFAWSDDQGGSGVLPTYTFTISSAQLATIPTRIVNVTLAVTDPLGQTSTARIPVVFTQTVPVRIVAGLASGATYTTDGGVTLNTFGSTSAMVPRRQPKSQSLAGFQDGTIQSLGVILYTFPAAVQTIFVNDVNNARITVALANGDLWRSIDAGATWNWLYSFGSSVAQIVETLDGQVTYVASSNSVWVSYRAFQDQPTVWASFAYPIMATQLLVNAFGNYVGSSTGQVLNVDTGAILAGPTSPIIGLAFNPRQSTLWVMELNGQFWRMPAGGSSLIALSTVAGGGGRLVPVNPIPGFILTANTLGAQASLDAGLTWRRIIAGQANNVGWYAQPVPGSS